MKILKHFRNILITSMLLVVFFAQSVSAAEPYTYEVTVYCGNIGTAISPSIVTSGQTAVPFGSGIRISGLKYGEPIILDARNSSVTVPDEKYYVRGIRSSGADNSSAEMPSFNVTGDMEFVVAYGIKGDMVDCIVNYQDVNGNKLAESQTYYGNDGEKIIVPYIYIEGYLPQAYNISKTLVKGGNNVITFVYTPIQEGAQPTPAPTPAPTPTPTPAPTPAPTPTPTPTPAPTPDEDAAAPDADAGTPDADAGTPDADTPPADNPAEVTDEDENVPLDMLDADDEEVPMANINLNGEEEGANSFNYLPFFIGVAIASVAAVGFVFFYLYRRKKAQVVKSKGTDEN